MNLILIFLFSQVLIIKWKDTGFYNEAIKGFLENYKGNYEIYDCKGEEKECINALSKYDKYEIIATVGEVPLKIALNLKIKRKIVFFSLYNPELIINENKDITGVSLNIPSDIQFQKIRKIFPNKKRIGVFYSEYILIRGMKENAASAGFDLKSIKVHKKLDVMNAIQELKDCDIIIMNPDPVIQDPQIISSIISFTIENRIPLFVPSHQLVKAGAPFGLVPDYYENGRIAGELVNEILNKNMIPKIKNTEKVKLYINLKTLKELKINLPQEIIKEAEGVFE